MTDDIDNDATTLHESGGVVQPTDAQIKAWPLTLYDFTGKITDINALIVSREVLRGLALAVPQAPLQAQAVLRKVVHYGNCMATGNIMAAEAAMSAVEDAIASPAPLQAEPVPVVASEPLQELHGLLYVAQRTHGKAQAEAIGTARLLLARLRDEAKAVDLSEDGAIWQAIIKWHRSVNSLDTGGVSIAAATVDNTIRTALATPQAEPAVAEQARVTHVLTREDVAARYGAKRKKPKHRGDCFGVTVSRRSDAGDLVELFVEDDGNWHFVSAFDVHWLPELQRMLALASQSTPPPESAPVWTQPMLDKVHALADTLPDLEAPPPESAERDFDAELEAADAGPPLIGRWHHGDGVLVSGSIRIAQWDCDTNPPTEFRERVLNWMCDTLNAALAANPTAQPDGGSKA